MQGGGRQEEHRLAVPDMMHASSRRSSSNSSEQAVRAVALLLAVKLAQQLPQPFTLLMAVWRYRAAGRRQPGHQPAAVPLSSLVAARSEQLLAPGITAVASQRAEAQRLWVGQGWRVLSTQVVA